MNITEVREIETPAPFDTALSLARPYMFCETREGRGRVGWGLLHKGRRIVTPKGMALMEERSNTIPRGNTTASKYSYLGRMRKVRYVFALYFWTRM